MPRLRLLLVLVLALILAACGGTAPAGSSTGAPGGSTPASGTPAASPETTAEPAETEPPTTEEPATDEPVATEPPASDDPGPSLEPSTSPESACITGTNSDFFREAAAAVSWPVVCAVLPKGWFVTTGTHNRANGGKLVIGYKGPAGATLALSEGTFCADAGGCVPAGTDAGDVPFGPMTGTLVRSSDGGFAVVVDRGLHPSWLLETHGLDEAATLALSAALAEVAG